MSVIVFLQEIVLLLNINHIIINLGKPTPTITKLISLDHVNTLKIGFLAVQGAQ